MSARRAPTRSRLPGLLLAAAASGCAALGEGPDVAALPAFERERPVGGGPREWDLGWPLGHGESAPGRDESGLRPLWRSVRTDRFDRLEVLYPLFRTERDAPGGSTTRLFPILWRDSLPQAAGVDRDTSVMPFLYWGDEPGEGPYFLLFPVGGTVTQRFLSDRTTFVLFPLYAGTRTGEWRGHHLLWPVIHWGSDGAGRRGFRVLPFYGSHEKDGVFDRKTVLWPIVHWSAEDLDRRHPTRGWLVWPLVGRESATDGQTSTVVLWPFFSWADGPRAVERDLPFPFYRTRTRWGEREDGGRFVEESLFWLWPFHGRFERHDGERSGFAAWPIVFWWTLPRGASVEEAVVVAPFWWDKRLAPAAGGPGSRSWKAWPLAQGERRPDGSASWSALAPLPWFRWEEFEANWGVFWELVRVRRGADGSRAVDLLFSLVRERTGPEGERRRVPLVAAASSDSGGARWSLLEGLLGGETDGRGASSLRLLWVLRIPLGGGASR